MTIQSRIVNRGREIYYTERAFWEFQDVLSDYFYYPSYRINWNCVYWASAIRKHIQQVSSLRHGHVYSMDKYGTIYYEFANYFDTFYGEYHYLVIITKFEFANVREMMDGKSIEETNIAIKPSIEYVVTREMENGVKLVNNGSKESILKPDGSYLYFDRDSGEDGSWFVKVFPCSNGFAVSSDGNDISWIRMDGSRYSFANAKWSRYYSIREGKRIRLSERNLRRIIKESILRYLYN